MVFLLLFSDFGRIVLESSGLLIVAVIECSGFTPSRLVLHRIALEPPASHPTASSAQSHLTAAPEPRFARYARWSHA